MHGRRLAILTAGNFFVATSFMSVSGLLNEIAASLHWSVAQAGMLIAVFAVTAGVCAPVLATFGSRIDRRKLLTASLAVCAIALNSSLGYLGNSLGTTVGGRLWGVVGARYLPWAALLLVLASIWFSWLSDRKVRSISNSDAFAGS